MYIYIDMIYYIWVYHINVSYTYIDTYNIHIHDMSDLLWNCDIHGAVFFFFFGAEDEDFATFGEGLWSHGDPWRPMATWGLLDD